MRYTNIIDFMLHCLPPEPDWSCGQKLTSHASHEMRQVGLLASVLALFVLLRPATSDLAAADRTPRLPVVVNTWAFTRATEAAWDAITARGSASPALDAIEQVPSRKAAASAPKSASAL